VLSVIVVHVGDYGRVLVAKGLGCCAKALLFGTTLPGSILPKILVIGDGTTTKRLWYTLRTVLVEHPVITISLYFVRNTWLESNLQQIQAWSKLSSPGFWHLIMTSSMPGHGHLCEWSQGLVCIICCHCTTYASKSKHIFWHHYYYYHVYWNSLVEMWTVALLPCHISKNWKVKT
jgi:hypothetical protein